MELWDQSLPFRQVWKQNMGVCGGLESSPPELSYEGSVHEKRFCLSAPPPDCHEGAGSEAQVLQFRCSLNYWILAPNSWKTVEWGDRPRFLCAFLNLWLCFRFFRIRTGFIEEHMDSVLHKWEKGGLAKLLAY